MKRPDATDLYWLAGGADFIGIAKQADGSFTGVCYPSGSGEGYPVLFKK